MSISISLFDMFSIGIGPSSSHTVGPMIAANDFSVHLQKNNLLPKTTRLKTELFGSLALTGVGHGTDKAILNGLEGYTPKAIDPSTMLPRMQKIIANGKLNIAQQHTITYEHANDLIFNQRTFLPKHSNGLCFTAYDSEGAVLHHQIYYSVGGGFIVTDEGYGEPQADSKPLPYPFESGEDLLLLSRENNLTIAEIMMENEKVWRTEDEIHQGILEIAGIMEDTISNGCKSQEDELPGRLHVKRRAPNLYKKLAVKSGVPSIYESDDVMNRLNLYALAVNEENAAGGRIVTAPTNGAAGIIPAVMKYLQLFHERASQQHLVNYFLVASAIGILYKKNASISGAEVGCQGEVGVASSMAAAGLTAVLDGTTEQIENAAEIAMEHHLGMTCDPVAGLVQIPCIERNAMGALKAVNAARLALIGEGQHVVSLDKVIQTMRDTGRDMMTIYKETSQGGLAVNVVEC